VQKRGASSFLQISSISSGLAGLFLAKLRAAPVFYFKVSTSAQCITQLHKGLDDQGRGLHFDHVSH